MSTFSDGVYEFGGAPVSGARFSSPWATHWFVDGINGSAGNSGRKPDHAFNTIQAAVTAASRNDIIYINPHTWNTGSGFTRYTEDVAVTSGVSGTDMTNANISIIGISAPGAAGDFLGVRWKHATATNLTNDAPALHVENIGFFSEGATYGVLLRNNGATLTQQGSQGTSFYNCAFKGKGLYVLSGGDGLTIEKCRFQCAYDGTVAQLNYSASLNPGRRLTVRNCEWLDGNGTVPSGPCITIAPPVTEILIRDCYFPQVPTGDAYISAAGANEGLIANCHFATSDLSTTGYVEGDALIAAAMYDYTGIQTST